jgi:hypothetical protein
LAVLGLEVRGLTLASKILYYLIKSLHQLFLVVGFFQERVSQTIRTVWLQTVILLISAFQVARITGMSHWHPALPRLSIIKI